MTLLRVERLHKRFGYQTVLDDVSLSVAEGELEETRAKARGLLRALGSA